MKKLTKQSPVTLVELPATQYGILNREISFDIYSKSKMPARALPVLESILKADGFSDVKSICPLDGENGKLSPENQNRIYNSKVLGISSITRTSPQSLELARNYKLVNPNGMIIAGGPDPTFRTEDWLRDVDIVVKGEGEKTILELMERLTQDYENLNDIDGIGFKKGKEIEITKPRKLLTSEELSQLPHPFYNPKIRQEITTGVVETSRGCPNDCEFCTVTKIYGRRYRTKSIDYVIEELKRTKDIGEYLFFTDDNFTAIPNYTIKLLEAMIEKNLNKKYSLVQTTIKLADKPKLMDVLKTSRINALCIGIESINNVTLQNYKKPYTAEQNKTAIKTLKEAGFWIHGMMMLGGEGDTPETLKETSEWINNNLDTVQLFAPIPIPGSSLFNKMQEQGRILTKDYSLYDGQHVISRPTNFTPYELQKTIYNMYEDFYSVKNSWKRLKHSPNKTFSFEILAYTQIRGRKMLYNPQSNRHLEFLKSVS